MTWFYNSHSGEIENESPPAPLYFVLEAELHAGTGWHAYPTQAEVLAAVAANHWPAPTTNLGQNLSNDASNVPVLSQAVTVGDFLTRLEKAATWQRVVEVILGGILVIVAAKGMLDPVTQPVVQGAKKAVGTVKKAGRFA